MSIDSRRVDEVVTLTDRRASTSRDGRVLLAEPDPVIAAALIDSADGAGVRTQWCTDGAAALLAVGANLPAVLVVAPEMAGGVSAAQVIATVRGHSDVPILVGAQPGNETLTRQAIAAGATATTVRPYDFTDIRQFMQHPPAPPPRTALVAGPIRVDASGFEVHVRDVEVLLTRREFELLIYLIEQRGRVADADQISRAVWGRTTDTNTVAVHIRRLRTKLGADPDHGHIIRTIRGVGYRLAPSLCE
ncbi:winged helix-turn-helix transcriptional regulator [Rhodococcus wratislaviensis]|uniref:winged helix-turn-helix transcriptional regulator n=1 Tax=Rhodococcus wratislaviensis TaxID=44752 RepID=UPI00364E7583